METDEVLETGHGPLTAARDNLLNDFVRGEADAFESLARARGERILDDAEFDVLLTDGESPTPFGNVVLLRRPIRDAEWPALSDRMHDFYGGRPGGPFLCFSAWPTPDLRPFGFGLVGHPPMMLRPAAPLEVEPPAGLEVRVVTDAADAARWERVLIEAYPVPELHGAPDGGILPERAVAATGWTYVLGLLDGEPVGTAAAFVDRTYSHVEFVSALPSVRGRGVGRALTAAVTALAPDRPAMLIASDPGRPVYERLGYLSLLRFAMWAGHRRA